MKIVLCTMLLLVLVGGCAKEKASTAVKDVAVTLNITENIDPEDADAVKTIAEMFFKDACPALYDERAQLDPVKVVSFKSELFDDGSGTFLNEALDWQRSVELNITGNHDLTMGHTLQYFIGGPKNPGVVVQKDIAAGLCGWIEKKGRQDFADIGLDDPLKRGARRLSPSHIGSSIFLPVNQITLPAPHTKKEG